jgi:Terminase RNaseH-like domain
MKPRKRLNLKPWMQRLTIKTKDARLERLNLDDEFAWAQRIFVAEVQRQADLGIPIRIIVLKARQLGISTASEGVLFNWCFMFPGTNALVLSKDREGSETIFEMAKLMWDTWPMKALFTASRSSARRLSWAETVSNFRVATARGQNVGRGSTLRAVHASEVAFWEDAESVMTPLSAAVADKPGTIIILESTANGVGGFFYDTWMAAERGESDYVPLFFAWWRHPEYQIRNHNLTQKMLSPKELAIQERYGLTLSQLAWRRRKIRTECSGDEDMFDQEYPMSPDVAFLSTGRNVFPLEKLADCYRPPGYAYQDGRIQGMSRGMLINNNGKLDFIHDNLGFLTVFKMPNKRLKIEYVVAADPSRTIEGDPCCIQVLRRDNLEQVAVWRGWATQNELAEEIANLAAWYGEALVNCEIEGGGGGVIAVLQHLRVPNIWRWKLPDRPLHKRGNVLGWSTNSKTKSWGIGQLIHYTAKCQLIIHDPKTYHEMREYINIDGIEMGPASGDGHDDTVMALMIALMTTITEDPVNFEALYGMGGVTQSFVSPAEENLNAVALDQMTGGYGELD